VKSTSSLTSAGLDYISSAGLRSILATAKKLKSENRGNRFSGLRDGRRKSSKISGFNSIFKIFESETNSVANLDKADKVRLHHLRIAPSSNPFHSFLNSVPLSTRDGFRQERDKQNRTRCRKAIVNIVRYAYGEESGRLT